MAARATDVFLANMEQVLHEIEVHLQSGAGDIPQSQLESVVKKLGEMKEAVTSGNLPPTEARYTSLTHMIVDQWPLAHPLGSAIAELEGKYLVL